MDLMSTSLPAQGVSLLSGGCWGLSYTSSKSTDLGSGDLSAAITQGCSLFVSLEEVL